MITLTDYWTGPDARRRDQEYAGDLTEAIAQAATVTVMRVSELLARAEAAGVSLDRHPVTGSLVSSGWRPPQINAATAGAAAKSKHMTGHACDVYDPDGDLDQWCMDNLHELQAIGLWLEHPGATKGWCHLQTVPPGRPPRPDVRVFWP